MSNPLAIYLHDHLAGASLAVELLKSMRKKHAGEPLGEFAGSLLVEVEADRELLLALAERAGAGPSALKNLGAWMSEKVGRIKLGGQNAGDLATFEALEFLMLGIRGKWALWRALGVVAASDARLQGTDFENLMTRARQQEIQVEQRRMEVARTAFSVEE